MSDAPDPFVTDSLRFRAAGSRLSDVPEAWRRHEREWREHMARQAVDTRGYHPLRQLWEIHGRLS